MIAVKPGHTAIIVQASDPGALASARQIVPAENVTHELPIIDGFACEVDNKALQKLSDLRDAATGLRITPDREVQLHDPAPDRASGTRLDIAAGTLHMQAVWDQGYRGQGIGIAIIDTGIAPHPDLASRIVAFHDVVNGQASPYDDNGHGSHVSGIAAGNGSASNGRLVGMAPEASLIGVKVLSAKGSGSNSNIIDGIQWAVQNKQRYNIRAMNISIGGPDWIGWQHDPLAQAVEKAVGTGIVVAVAAGNAGPQAQTVETPGIAPSAITVANLDENFTPDRSDDSINDSSSRGPTKHDQLAKPDVAAPGTMIESCDTHSGYVYMTGTSMASPMVAGNAALLCQARPNSTPQDIKDALMQTTAPLPKVGPEAQGRGMIDPPAALAALLSKH
jgi:serine protease AprX